MIFSNKTKRTVYLSVGTERAALEPSGSISLKHQEVLLVTLSHDYGSTAMSEMEIISNEIDNSDLRWFAGHENKPVFYIVPDCAYEMRLPADAQVDICRETLRPSYACAYDRLYPVASAGTVREVSCLFSERQSFEKRYQKAMEKPKKTALNILLICVTVLGVLIALLACMARTVAGGIFAMVTVLITGIALLLLRLVGSVIITQLCKAECRILFSDFESDKIISY